jgi:pyrroline-5-carboxylate reductase
MEAMERAGRELGLNDIQSHQLSLETFLGAAKLESISKESPATLRAKVTSKNGTTAYGIKAMESAETDKKIIRAIHSAHKRSEEIGNEFSNK